MLEASSEELESIPTPQQRWLQVKLVKCPWEEVEAGSVRLLQPRICQHSLADPPLPLVTCRQTQLGAATLVGSEGLWNLPVVAAFYCFSLATSC